MPNKRGLGRGLDALIPTEIETNAEFDPTSKVSDVSDTVQQIPLEQIKPNPHQPRQQFDQVALKELADSIRQHGVVQPLVVTKQAGVFELIAGERRLRASKLAGIKTVPVIERSFDEQAKLEVALIENVQRANLNPIETATAYKKLVDQFNLKLDDVAKRVGKEMSTVSNTIRLLNLPLEAKRAVAEGRISEGHARAVLAVPAEHQLDLLKLIEQRGLTVRQAETLAREFKQPQANRQSAVKQLATTNQWTDQLSQALKTGVTIGRSAKGNRLIIDFSDDQELERIVKRLLG